MQVSISWSLIFRFLLDSAVKLQDASRCLYDMFWASIHTFHPNLVGKLLHWRHNSVHLWGVWLDSIWIKEQKDWQRFLSWWEENNLQVTGQMPDYLWLQSAKVFIYWVTARLPIGTGLQRVQKDRRTQIPHFPHLTWILKTTIGTSSQLGLMVTCCYCRLDSLLRHLEKKNTKSLSSTFPPIFLPTRLKIRVTSVLTFCRLRYSIWDLRLGEMHF